MYNLHKYSAGVLFLFVLISTCSFLPVKINESLTENLITFFSITFGFYMTSLSVLYSSSFIQKLYDKIDPQIKTQTKLHTLKSYFSISTYWSLFSIVLLILFSLFASKDINSMLSLNIGKLNILDFWVNIDSCIESIIVSTAALNIYFLVLLLKIFLNGLLEEGKFKN